VASANRDAADKRISGAAAQVEEARTNLPLADANVEAARAATAQADAARQSAKIDLDDTKLYAPFAGRVTRKAVDVGDYVQVGQSLLALVPSELWVTANFKENQLAHMRPGQPVDVEIDAEGGRTYRAHVDSIQAGSGARFSLFPPENATGNYVKIVQRVPVKIVFDDPLDSIVTLGPGESVDPFVHTGWTRIPLVVFVLVILVAAALIAGLARLARRPAKS
jgi:membrane fusion protein (multidrug efflux system)